MGKRLKAAPGKKPKRPKKPKPAKPGDTALSVVATVEPKQITEHYSVSVNGLLVAGRPAFEESEAVGGLLVVAERGMQFAIGDFLLHVEEQHGEKASQIVDYGAGWKQSTCDAYRWLASKVAPHVRRMDRLGVRHHQLVATLPEKLQVKWLQLAANDKEDEPWTVARLALAMDEGGDLPESAWWVNVLATDKTDQEKLMDQLRAQGRTVKALARRKKRGE